MQKSEIIRFLDLSNAFGKRKASSIDAAIIEALELAGVDAEGIFCDEGIRWTYDEYFSHVYNVEKDEREREKAERKAGKKAEKAKEVKPPELVKTEKERGIQMPNGRYLLTYAQNNTPVVAGFMGALATLSDSLQAQPLIVAGEYCKALFGHGEEEIYYAPELMPFMAPRGEDLLLGSSFIVAGSSNTLPTAKRPLSGFESYSSRHTIVCHTQIGLQLLPAKDGTPKRLMTTGSATERNYIDRRKAGATASALHSFGVLLVDTVAGVTRHIHYSEQNQCFVDYGKCYGAGGLSNIPTAAIVFGDVHAEKQCTAGLDYMVEMALYFQPYHIVIHDLLDFESENHHNKSSAWHRHAFRNSSVEGDIDKAGQVLQDLQQAGDAEILVVSSNHDRALDRWLQEARQNEIKPCDLLTWHELNAAKLRGDVDDSMLAYALGLPEGAANIKFLPRDKPYIIEGWDVGSHGDCGSSGSRGSLAGFAKLGKPCVIGHSHSPGIMGHAYQVGVSSQNHDFGYNHGPSAWSQGDLVIYEGGVVQMILPALV